MDQGGTVSAPVVKVASMWAAIGITTWSEAAAFVGFLYSLVLLGEWCWKRFGRSMAERYGLVKPRKAGDDA